MPSEEPRGVSRTLKLAVLLTVIAAIVILIVSQAIPKAQRPHLPTVVTTTLGT